MANIDQAAAKVVPATQVQPTYIPTNKTIGATVGSAVGVIIVWLINEYLRTPQTPLPVGIEGAITVLVTFALGYFVPHGARESILVTGDGAKAAVKA